MDIQLRPLRDDDADAIQALAADALVSRYTANIPYPYPEDGARRFLEKARRLAHEGQHVFFAIADRENDRLVGVSEYICDGDGMVTIGYWIGAPYWGRGIASRAVGLLIAHVEQTVPDAIFSAKVLPQNAASIRVLEKNGFAAKRQTDCAAPARGGEMAALLFRRLAMEGKGV